MARCRYVPIQRISSRLVDAACQLFGTEHHLQRKATGF